jgi:predicted acylesterase/phospholipase RssA
MENNPINEINIQEVDKDKDKDVENPSSTQIKHIVFSGGSTIGISGYSFLKESHKAGYWNIRNIESMYSTSIGCIFCLMIALQFEWDVLDDYILKRPWHNVFKIDIFSIIESLKKSGILGKKIIEETFLPLFKAKDLHLDITLKELYEITKIDFHLYTVQINPIVLVDLSHKTHPDWSVLEAIYCSCCLPVLFIPYEKDNHTYVDGGVIANYPVYSCYNNVLNKDEILGIYIKFKKDNMEISSEFTLFNYLLVLIQNLIDKISIKNEDISIPNEIIIEADSMSFYKIYLVASSIDERLKLFNRGIELWKNYSNKINWNNKNS